MNQHASHQSDSAPPAVIVIDLQTEMFAAVDLPPIHQAELLVARVRALIARARKAGCPVCFIRHDGPVGDSLAPGEPGWPIWPALGQTDDEPTFSKSVGDAFSQPALVAWLASKGIHEVVLLGAQTEHCVKASVAGGLNRGLAVTVLADAHSTWDSGDELAPAIIARHNDLFASLCARLIESAELLRD